MKSRPATYGLFLAEETPIADRLEAVIGSETLATFHGQPGGEWDTLRETPLRVRRRLSSARYLSLRGMQPDRFSDLLQGNGVQEPDPILWYIRNALRAIDERQAARRRAREKALAQSTGHSSLFEHRNQLAREAGFRSYYDYRMKVGWGDGHGRGID